MNRYKIGDIQFLLEKKESWIQEDKYTDCFCITEELWDENAATIRYLPLKNDFKEQNDFREIKKSGLYDLYINHKKEMFLVNHWGNCRLGFGYWMDDLYKKDLMPYYVNSEMENQVPIDMMGFLCRMGIHAKVLKHDAMVLHASYISWNGKAILFTAPSQTGKSTQADLWKRFAGARIINGDRALLRKRNGKWHSFGYPYCGSSDICFNETYPLEAIVVLEQGPENKIVPMTPGEKIRALVSGTECFSWSNDEINQVIALAETVAGKVPVIKLICTPDVRAVDVLKTYLEN